MARFMTDRVVSVPQADIAIAQSAGQGPAVLLIHGNSSCKEVFRNQLLGDLGKTYRLIAMDLPGHGDSSDAHDPAATYTMPGYAQTALALMEALGVARYAVMGWSLGGHIGIDMLPRTDRIAGLMITGTPPAGKGEGALAKAFLPSEHMGLAGKRDFTPEECEIYARATAGINAPYEPFLLEAVIRTDGRARETMLGAFAMGIGESQEEIVATSPTPLAIVNGGDEPFANNEFVRGQRYAALWEDTVHILPGLGHAPFWEDPSAFDPHLARFLGDVLRQTAAPPQQEG